jgi:assimilatory nitrate reductase catalytic subunit
LQSGTDTTLFGGLLQYLVKHDVLDHAFISNYTNQFEDAVKASAELADLNVVSERCGLPIDDLNAFYRLFADTENVVTLYSQGVNQSSLGTDNSNSIINCHLATGRIGKPAMGPFSITGQPNAMGGREVGGLANQLAAHMDIDNPVHHDLVSRFWNTDKLATKAGAKAVDLFNDVASGKIKAVWIMATNPAVSLPDANKVRDALKSCELVVVSDCELNTDTTQFADVLLPAVGWAEKDGTVTNSERRISHQRAFMPAAGEAKPDWWIISKVAQKMGFNDAGNYASQVEIFREHAALSGFENNGVRDFDISAFTDMTQSEYDALEPIQWPVNQANPNGTPRLFTENQFYTPSKKANFIAISLRKPVNSPSEDYPLILNTGRIRDQWHTMTRTARSAKLNGHIPEPFVEVHPDDADHYGLTNNALAKISSEWGTVFARVQVAVGQRQGSVFIPMHWNEQYAAQSCVDTIVNPEVDPISGQPESKHTPVKIEAYEPIWHGFILSRDAITLKQSHYWIRIKGEKFWRYEIAGDEAITEYTAWAKSQLGEEGDWLEFTDGGTQRYRAGQVINDRLQSVLFVGPNHELPTRTWLSQLFNEETLSDQHRLNLLAGKPGGDQPDVGALVCACFGVGENTIKAAISCGKAKTVEDIGKQLKAGTNCGSCLPEIKKFFS